jgi:hypothetical protein
MKLVSLMESSSSSLCVHALCINQKNDAGMEKQLAQMDLIYTGAPLLITAAAGINTRASLPGLSEGARRFS